MDEELLELCGQLSAARSGLEVAESIVNTARKEERRLTALVRERIKSVYNVDPWRL